MKRLLIRYKVKPDQVEHNEELVRAVYEELNRAKPEGFKYATFRLDGDGAFVHIASQETADNPLDGIAAFQRFTDGIRERCEEPPVVSELREVGSYRLFS